MARDQTSEFQRLVDSDPELQRLIAQARSGPYDALSGAMGRGRSADIHQGITARIQALIPGGLPSDYAINAKTGKVARAGYFERNADWIVPAATFGGAFGLSLLPAFGPAAATTAGGHSLGGGLAAGATTGGFNAAGTAGGILGGSAAAKGFSSLLSNPDFWGLLAGIGTNIYSAKTQSDAANQANDLAKQSADAQAAALEKAIALQEKMYNQDRATQSGLYAQNRTDLAPYRASGQGSVGKLSYLLGVPGFESGPQSYRPGPEVNPFEQANSPSPILSSTAGTSGTGPPPVPQPPSPVTQQPQGPATVRMRSPDGKDEMDVPASQVAFFESRGATRV